MKRRLAYRRVLAVLTAGAMAAGIGQLADSAPSPTTAPASGPSGWYQWRGPGRDGVSFEKDWSPVFPQGGPKVLWKAAVGAGYSTVTVSDGRAYTMGNANGTDTIWCFNADTGEVLWKRAYSCPAGDYPGPRCTPAVDGKRLYALSRAGHFFCLDAAKGDILWTKDVAREFGAKPPGWGLASSALILNEWVILDVGPVVALRRDTGQLVWKSQAYPAGYSSPMPFVMGANRGLAVFNAMGLVILNAADGKELSRFPWTTEYDVNAVTPIIFEGKVFISSGYEVGCALLDVSKSQATVVWRSKALRNHYTSCVLLDGYLYGYDEGQLRCVEAKTGQVKWTKGGLGKGSLMAADGKLILISEGGDLVTAEAAPAAYKQLSSAKVLPPTCWTMPVLAGGKIYCRNHDGEVVCVDVGASK